MSRPAMNTDQGGGTYLSELYDYSAVATGVKDFDTVTEKHLAQFHQLGYLVVDDAFTAEEVQNALDALSYLASGQNPDYGGILLEKKAEGVPIDELPPEKRQDYIRKLNRFVTYDTRLQALAEHPKLINVLTRIMGEALELYANFAMLKPPKIGREKPWHQDQAYFDLPLGTLVVGVWIALDKATPENGCMVVRPGSHLEGPVVHFQRRDWQICDTDVINLPALAAPLNPGGCLLFHNLLHHGTPGNFSEQRRRAMQFHYKPVSVQASSVEDRLATFGEEGKDVTC